MAQYSHIKTKKDIQGYIFKEILDNINSYLDKNKGSVADYELIKDIIDRNLDKEEEKISGHLALPLYLGLMGTMLGVIIGLFFMPELKDAGSDNGILAGVNELLEGVKIAMMASVAGLLMTVINTIRFFRARKKVEEEKNKLLNFIQINLLPALNHSTANSLVLLQNNLMKFNEEFSNNANIFNNLLDKIQGTSENNLDLIMAMESIDLSNIVKYNEQTMLHMQKSFKGLKDFAEYLGQSSQFLEEARSLNNSLRENLVHLDSYKEVIENLNISTKILNDTGRVIQAQFTEADERKNKLNAIIADYNADTNAQLDRLNEISQRELLALEEQNNEKIRHFKEQNELIDQSLNGFYEKLTNYTHNIFEAEGNTFRSLEVTLSNLNKNIHNLKVIENGINDLKDEIRNLQSGNNKVEFKTPEKTFVENILPYFVLGFILFISILSILLFLRLYT